jgi:hypothetical protein
MSKEVTIYETETDFIAVFSKDAVTVDSKTITVVEYDGLLDMIDFNSLPVTIDAEKMYDEWDNLCFDNDGDATNFELMLYNLVKEN